MPAILGGGIVTNLVLCGPRAASVLQSCQSASSNLNVVGVPTSNRELKRLLTHADEAVVLVDEKVPPTLSAPLHEALDHGTPFLVLLETGRWSSVRSVLSRGARGGIVEEDLHELPVAVAALTRGGVYISSTPSANLVEARDAVPDAGADRHVHALSRREIEVLRALGIGRSTSQIAEDLSITVATVRAHVLHLLQKLGAENRVQMVAFAYRTGLLSTAVDASPLASTAAKDGFVQ